MLKKSFSVFISMGCLVILFSLLLINVQGALAVIRNVPSQYPTIQGAINASINGDVVAIQPGTYTENIRFNGKRITVRSTDPNDPNMINTTIINGSAVDSVCRFINGEGSNSRLAGLTLTNGHSTLGGGIYCNASSPTIINCIIGGNSSTQGGAGIFCNQASPGIINCFITQNSTQSDGGGIYAYFSSPAILGCEIIENSATNGGGILLYSSASNIDSCSIMSNTAVYGGGVYCYTTTPSPRSTFINCILLDNQANFYGGGMFCDTASPEIVNCNIVGNNAGIGGGIFGNNSSFKISSCIIGNNSQGQISYQSGSPVVNYTNIEDGFSGVGNINADPMFVAPENGDLHLDPNSPCIDAGDPNSILDFDKDGTSRPQDGDGDGVARIDMGAYEYYQIIDIMAICRDATFFLDGNSGQVVITPEDIDNGSYATAGIASMYVNPNIFDCEDAGSRIVTLTVIDTNDNLSTCESMVNIADQTPPQAMCKNIIVQLDPNGRAFINPNDIDNGSTDNCSIVSMEVSPDLFGVDDIGDNTVVLTVTDANNNASTCEATVMVEAHPEPAPDLSGKIMNIITRQTLRGAKITLAGKTEVFTDQSGEFAFEKVLPGPKTIVISKRGFRPITLKNVYFIPSDKMRVNIGLIPRQ